MATRYSKAFHDINNTLGALIMNIEVSASRGEGIAREAAAAALVDLERLEQQLIQLRSEVDSEE